MSNLPRLIATAALITGALVAGPVAAAQASDASLRGTLRRDLPHITSSQLRIRAATAKLQKTHSSVALVRAIEAQNRNLSALERRLRREPGSTRTGRRAKADLLKGLRLIVGSNAILARDLVRAAHHRRVSKRQVAAATVADRRGNRDLLLGAQLLKL